MNAGGFTDDAQLIIRKTEYPAIRVPVLWQYGSERPTELTPSHVIAVREYLQPGVDRFTGDRF